MPPVTEGVKDGVDRVIHSPVFVDASGRRRGWVTWAVVAAAAVCVGYVLLLGFSLTGGPIKPGDLLPLPGLARAHDPADRTSPGTATPHDAPAGGGAGATSVAPGQAPAGVVPSGAAGAPAPAPGGSGARPSAGPGGAPRTSGAPAASPTTTPRPVASGTVSPPTTPPAPTTAPSPSVALPSASVSLPVSASAPAVAPAPSAVTSAPAGATSSRPSPARP